MNVSLSSSNALWDRNACALHKAAAAFPRSFAKVQRMARVVIEEQFVSFIC